MIIAFIILAAIVDIIGYETNKSKLQHLPWYVKAIPFIWLKY